MPTEEPMRTCHKCGQLLPESAFYQRKGNCKYKYTECKECVKKRQREYAKANPEIVKAISAKGRENNREKIRQRNKEYYARTKDDPAHVEARKATYERNKDKWHKQDREKRKAFNAKWKRPCEKCGEERLYLIQFHHIDPSTKLFCIGANATTMNEESLQMEIKKCVCLCSNCHDEFHYFYGSKPTDPINALKEYLGRELADG